MKQGKNAIRVVASLGVVGILSAPAAAELIYARADAETKRKAIENAYQPLTPDVLPDWTSDTSLTSARSLSLMSAWM